MDNNMKSDIIVRVLFVALGEPHFYIFFSPSMSLFFLISIIYPRLERGKGRVTLRW
jgi:hypothetical protein